MTDDATVDVIAPELAVSKTVSLDGSCPGLESVQATNGATATYCFVVTNSGDVAVDNVVVNDLDIFPPYLTNVGSLAVGQAATVSTDRVVSGDLTNTVSVTGEDPNGDPVGPVTDDAEVDEIAPSVAVGKTVSLDGSCPGVDTGAGDERRGGDLLLRGHEHRRCGHRQRNAR